MSAAYRTSTPTYRPPRWRRLEKIASILVAMLLPIAVVSLVTLVLSFSLLAEDACGRCCALVQICATIGIGAGIFGTVLRLSLRGMLAISLAVMLTFIAILAAVEVGPGFSTSIALAVPLNVASVVIAAGATEWWRRPVRRRELPELPPQPALNASRPPRPPVEIAAPEPEEEPLPSNGKSVLVAVILIAPLVMAIAFVLSVDLAQPIESTMTVVYGAASIALFVGMMLQLRGAPAKWALAIASLLVTGTSVLAAVVDRRLCHGWLGFVGAEAWVLPGAMIFAAIVGTFMATALRYFAEGAPLLVWIAREEFLGADDDELFVDKIPDSTRHLLERARSRRKR